MIVQNFEGPEIGEDSFIGEGPKDVSERGALILSSWDKRKGKKKNEFTARGSG